jgi:hypothetical protein
VYSLFIRHSPFSNSGSDFSANLVHIRGILAAWHLHSAPLNETAEFD